MGFLYSPRMVILGHSHKLKNMVVVHGISLQEFVSIEHSRKVIYITMNLDSLSLPK